MSSSFSEKRHHFLIGIFQIVGKSFLDFAKELGGMSLLMFQVLRAPFNNRFEWPLMIRQVYDIGMKSLALTNLIAIFTGAVLALQFIVGLRRFGLELYAGQVVGIAITRELGPVLTALMVAARVGSGITAQLGSMTVSEQVMAIRAMGGSPVAKLVLPRVLMTTLMTPLLTVIADVVGIFGGMITSILETGISSRYYFDQVQRTVEVGDFASGIAKTFFFGMFIGVIACYKGLNVKGGTKGVGDATTSTVVQSSVTVFVSDFFLTKLFLLF